LKLAKPPDSQLNPRMPTEMQHTIAAPASLEGTSLHTGQKVTLTIKPAPADHGFKFRRVDLPDQPFIDAEIML